MEITDANIEFATQAATPLEEYLEVLSLDKAAALLNTSTEIAVAASQRFGVHITAQEAAALSHTKTAVISGGSVDIEGALAELARKSVKVAHALAQRETPDDDAARHEAELARLSGAARINYARAHGLERTRPNPRRPR